MESVYEDFLLMARRDARRGKRIVADQRVLVAAMRTR